MTKNNIVNIKENLVDNTGAPKLQCPTCKKNIVWNDSYPSRPFCSKRCKLIDLGDWAAENHRIPGDDVFPLGEEDY